ncbi:MAG: YqgE/AlgH family protein [Pseudomonadota bacterium]
MSAPDDSTDLTGKLLLAMPGMGDPRFDQSVIFLCSYSENGAMGLIVNKPLPSISFSDILVQLEIETDGQQMSRQVHVGGPVERGRGFVLHTPDYMLEDVTLDVDGCYGMTATRDILEDMSRGDGPNKALMAMGYSGWGPGQLESEIQRNGWLICDAPLELVFETDATKKWLAALSLMGIDPLLLSSDGGHA